MDYWPQVRATLALLALVAAVLAPLFAVAALLFQAVVP